MIRERETLRPCPRCEQCPRCGRSLLIRIPDRPCPTCDACTLCDGVHLVSNAVRTSYLERNIR